MSVRMGQGLQQALQEFTLGEANGKTIEVPIPTPRIDFLLNDNNRIEYALSYSLAQELAGRPPTNDPPPKALEAMRRTKESGYPAKCVHRVDDLQREDLPPNPRLRIAQNWRFSELQFENGSHILLERAHYGFPGTPISGGNLLWEEDELFFQAIQRAQRAVGGPPKTKARRRKAPRARRRRVPS